MFLCRGEKSNGDRSDKTAHTESDSEEPSLTNQFSPQNGPTPPLGQSLNDRLPVPRDHDILALQRPIDQAGQAVLRFRDAVLSHGQNIAIG